MERSNCAQSGWKSWKNLGRERRGRGRGREGGKKKGRGKKKEGRGKHLRAPVVLISRNGPRELCACFRSTIQKWCFKWTVGRKARRRSIIISMLLSEPLYYLRIISFLQLFRGVIFFKGKKFFYLSTIRFSFGLNNVSKFEKIRLVIYK